VNRLRLTATVPLSLVLLGACGKSPANKAREAGQTARSWQATLEMLAEARDRNAIPEVYARQVDSLARSELARQSAEQ
jgi:hypothetical protein